MGAGVENCFERSISCHSIWPHFRFFDVVSYFLQLNLVTVPCPNFQTGALLLDQHCQHCVLLELLAFVQSLAGGSRWHEGSYCVIKHC